jgi:hypothetical protein
MFELVIWVTDKMTGTARRISREFNNAGAMAAWYNSTGKSIEREIDSMHKSGGSFIPPKKRIKK